MGAVLTEGTYLRVTREGTFACLLALLGIVKQRDTLTLCVIASFLVASI